MNIFWHIPLLGFIFAFIYALVGALLCCTVILIPVGKGMFSIAQYMLSPFSKALVPRKDLDLIKPQGERNTAIGAYIVLLKILYIPFGLVSAVCAVFGIVEDIISIIGIPCAVVWFRALPAVFNPIDKVCIPKDVADEIERIKSGAAVDKFMGRDAASGDSSAHASAPAEAQGPVAASTAANVVAATGVHGDDEQKLNDIIDNASMYKPELVEQCRHELQVRAGSEKFMQEANEYSDERLNEILSTRDMYAEELIYCCERVSEARTAERNRIAAEEAEARRIAAEKAAEEERLRRAEQWKKQRPFVFGAIGVAAVIITSLCVWQSIEHKKELALKAQQEIEAYEQAERERIAAEEAAKAAAEQARIEAEQARKEKERRAEEQRKQAEAQRKADEERRLAGYYKIGELYRNDAEAKGGIVFSVDGPHGKYIALPMMDEITKYEAKRRGILPSEEDCNEIFAHIKVIDNAIKDAIGTPLVDKHTYYWVDSPDKDKSMINFFVSSTDHMYKKEYHREREYSVIYGSQKCHAFFVDSY